MDTVEKLIMKRMRNVQIALQNMAKYITLIKDMLLGYDAEYYYKLIKNQATAANLCLEINETKYISGPPLEIIKTMIKLYSQLIRLEASARFVVDLYKDPDYMRRAVYNMSLSYITVIKKDSEVTQEYMTNFIVEAIADDKEIFKTVFDITLPKTTVDPDNKLLIEANLYNRDLIYDYFITEAKDIINKFTTNLIGRLIEMINDKTKQRTLELIIEKQLSDILEAGRVKLPFAGCQGTLSRYGLTPVSRSMTCEELFTNMKLDSYNPALCAEDNIKGIASNEVSVILLSNVNKSAIEFDLRPLIDYNFITINDLNIDPLCGLNKKTLKKYSTTKMLNPVESLQPIQRLRQQQSSVNVYDSAVEIQNTKSWYVIETIVHGLYRLMGISGEKLIRADQIAGLRDGVSTRCEKYNMFATDELIGNVFDQKNTRLLEDYAKTYIAVSPDAIKNNIVDKLVVRFKASYTGEKSHLHKDVKPIKTLAAFNDYITDPDLVQSVLLESMLHLSGTRGSGSVEYLVTYLIKFDVTKRKFLDELARARDSEPISPSIFVDYSGDELQRTLVDIYKGIVIRCVNELDRDNRWAEYDLSLKQYMLDKKAIIVS